MDLKKIVKIDNNGFNFSVDVKLLNRLAKRTDIAEAPYLEWPDVRMLAIVGIGRIPELEQGCYIDRQGGKWVLLAGLKSSKIPNYINGKCPAHMQYLAVVGTNLAELDFNPRPCLRELWLIDNPKLHYVSGLENLTGLQTLIIRLERLDSELNLSKMQALEELDLRGTELSEIRLDGQLMHLKKCDLRATKFDDLGFPNHCPALEWLAVSDDCIPLLPQEAGQKCQLEPAADVVTSEKKTERTEKWSTDKSGKRNPCNYSELAQCEVKLLDAIRKSCLNIQAEPGYYLKDGENGRGMEDTRNRRIRDDLKMLNYHVEDQTQRGLSGTGRGVGELDLLLYNDREEPWTIIEALRVSSGAKTEWDNHLNKLVANYNYFGAPCVYLLTYVDADVTDFQRIWDGYQHHIPKINPGEFTYCDKSLVVQNDVDGPQYIKIAICRYDCGGQITTAYHIFVRIPRQVEIVP